MGTKIYKYNVVYINKDGEKKSKMITTPKRFGYSGWEQETEIFKENNSDCKIVLGFDYLRKNHAEHGKNYGKSKRN